MTVAETGMLMSQMSALWPSYRVSDDASEVVYTAKMLNAVLSDIDLQTASMAVVKYSATTSAKFAPTAGEIRAMALEMTHGKALSAGEAWGTVASAIRRHGYCGEKAAMEAMDPVTRSAVRAMGYKTLCLSENQMADRAHFLKIYETIQVRDREELLVPESVRGFIATLAGKAFKALPEAKEEQYGKSV